MRLIYLLPILFTLACNETKVDELVTGNEVANYHDVPTIKVENYVNRMYIDLLGRVPLDAEMQREVNTLRRNNLNFTTRDSIIHRLQTDSSFIAGDGSYLNAWHQRIYNLLKSRFLEGSSDDLIRENVGPLNFGITVARANGDSVAVFRILETINRYDKLLESKEAYQDGLITINEMCARMLDNGVYDIINMNSLNFVNASFDDLFYRFPAQAEFLSAYDIIEYNKSAIIFGNAAANKREYCNVLVNSREFYEGMIRWCYFSLMNREATTQEIYNRFNAFYNSGDLKKLQQTIIRTDEYAKF